jgi:hypothetical protein
MPLLQRLQLPLLGAALLEQLAVQLCSPAEC